MIRPGCHHDPSAPWAREPRLRPVVSLPLRRQQGRSNRLRYLTAVAVGVALGCLLRSVLS